MKNLLEQRKSRLEEFNRVVGRKSVAYKPFDIPNHVFSQCENCQSVIYKHDLESNLDVCPFCGHHFKIGAHKRLDVTVDKDSFKELFEKIVSTNPLDMPAYEEKLTAGKQLSKLKEAVLTGEATIEGKRIAIGILDSNFMMGSMGSAVGEKVTRLIEHATKERLPLVIFSASGGARMQESILSLMQMAKTSAALNKHDAAGLLYISVLTNPTTGGVAASFASLGDINIAERSSVIGFAGARVIKQTIGQDLPPGFQTSHFQLTHGQVDMVVKRQKMRMILSNLIALHGGISHV